MFFLPFSGLNQGFTRPQGAARAVSPIYFVLPVVLIFSFYYLRRSPPESGKLEPDNERSDSSGRTKKSPGDESSANLTPSEGVSPDEGNASNKLLPPAAEPGLQILHDCEAPKIEYYRGCSWARREHEGNASNKLLPPAAEPGLQILHDCEAPKIDIVAVHGLGANPDYAWIWLPKNNPPTVADTQTNPLTGFKNYFQPSYPSHVEF
ncbi:NACHT and Ankyrin domain protein, partial [Metarhizium majus ARSEF 297]